MLIFQQKTYKYRLRLTQTYTALDGEETVKYFFVPKFQLVFQVRIPLDYRLDNRMVSLTEMVSRLRIS